MKRTYEELKTRLAEIHDLSKVARLLFWDQQTMMPRRGAGVRAEQLATLTRIAHERLVSDEIGRLLDDLRPHEESLPYESDEASLIRVTRRDYEKARRVPAELRAEMSRSASLALPAWAEARRSADFPSFLPHLRRNMELRHRYVECFDGFDEAYDVLLDDFERGMKTAEVRAVFDVLKRELVPFIAAVADRADAADDSCLQGRFPLERQREIEASILERFGFSSDSWRIDPTEHPFAANGGTTDIRITTSYREGNLNALFATMHEFGHGLYEHSVDPGLERTPLCSGVSLGLHESQSRTWENLVGRSRAFWRFFYPELQRAFPEQLAPVDVETFYRAVNKVQPSLIRIEADEVTYNFHVILRFELEQEILNDGLELADLPEAWNARMAEYLGVEVPDDGRGVLQDMHWAGGHIGYFPTYSLGNVMSVQIWERATAAMPDLDDQLERGEFGGLREWLRENLHRHGRKFTPQETLARVVGGPIDPGPYVRYLKAKLGEIYRLS